MKDDVSTLDSIQYLTLGKPTTGGVFRMAVCFALLLVPLQANAQFYPPIIDRTTDGVELIYEQTEVGFGVTWELDFYRNNAYAAGLSGNYTFLVMNPMNDENAEAPLWVFLHGGGLGYYDDLSIYRTLTLQDENSYNHEESFDDLWENELRRQTVDQSVTPMESRDVTLTRRISEGYRILLVSYCDHDLYSGMGTPYTNNPNGGEVNGLQATMSAVDFVAANYPTTHIIAQGNSAGSVGVYSLGIAYASEGTPLTAVISDSIALSPRTIPLFAQLAGEPGFPFGADFETQGSIDKVGILSDPNLPYLPEYMIEDGYRDTPTLFLGGDIDPFNGGNQPPIPEALAAGLNNGDWVFDGLRQAIANQPNSPHQVSMLDDIGHVPSENPGEANDIVDAFIANAIAGNPGNPFANSNAVIVDTFDALDTATIWATGTDWEISGTQAYSSGTSAYGSGSSRRLMTRNIDTSNATSITLTFKFRMSSVETNDNVRLQFRNGTTWQTVDNLSNYEQDTWLQASFTVNAAEVPGYFQNKLKVRINSAGIDNGEGIWVDDFVLTVE